MPPLHRLLPARSRTPPPSPSQARGLNSTQEPPKRKREMIGQACEHCRKQKSKCDGYKPSCSTCLQRKRQCEYSSSRVLDRASVQDLERRVRLLDAGRESMSQLFDQLRSRPEQDAINILQRIRKGEDPQSILKMIQDGDLLMQPWMASAAANNASTSSPLWGFAKREFDLYFWVLAPANLGLSKQSNPPMISHSFSSPKQSLEWEIEIIETLAPMLLDLPGFDILLDKRIDKVTARTWTEVPCEDRRFSDLLRLYFIVEHDNFAHLDKDLFLDDLATGNKDFCSSLLVNSVLCYAAHSSHQVKNRCKPWDEGNIGSHFYREARRLWQLEENKPSITTIQAACILATILSMDGKDKVGFVFYYQAISMGKELGFFRQPTLSQEEYETLYRSNPRYIQGCARTEWALLRLEKSSCFYFQIPAMTTSAPFHPIPYAKNLGSESTRVPSDSTTAYTASQVYLQTMQAAKCELWLQIHDIVCVAFSRKENARPLTIAVWKQLLEYHRDLISCMEYHALLQILIHLILRLPPSLEALSPYHATLSDNATHVRQTLKSLAGRYAALYNFRQPSMMVFHYFTIVAYSCLEEADIMSNLSSRQLFETCFNAIHDTTETVFLANTVLPPLEVAAQKQLGAMWSLPRVDNAANREAQLRKIIESTYSAYPSDLSNPNIDAARADFILRSMASLSLERGKCKPPNSTRTLSSLAIQWSDS